ncbi:hypothetical protein Lesp02_68300 [Lentzea sp. NBRC 105346]|uniref:hypothetical protein n=1 Tax=Lentzea sp. NBRC 105346 TaxID=3032205 RepID=UPI0024A256D2|nr:hypothetical protein [Lentzea sp. NBRC 105346]GLZ34643.1 hypothetical protein Lesp02_68300 [Lentzea sp. NBRC 105346]
MRAIAATLVLLAVAACGVDVPSALADKVRSGCAGAVKPEPVSVIIEGLEVEDVTGEWSQDGPVNHCSVQVQAGGGSRKALEVSVNFVGAEMAEKQQRLLCRERKEGQLITGPDGSCGLFLAKSRREGVSGGDFSVFGAAGDYAVTITAAGVSTVADEEGRDAAFRIFSDLRASDQFRK